jgi:hypothetical protein
MSAISFCTRGEAALRHRGQRGEPAVGWVDNHRRSRRGPAKLRTRTSVPCANPLLPVFVGFPLRRIASAFVLASSLLWRQERTVSRIAAARSSGVVVPLVQNPWRSGPPGRHFWAVATAPRPTSRKQSQKAASPA